MTLHIISLYRHTGPVMIKTPNPSFGWCGSTHFVNGETTVSIADTRSGNAGIGIKGFLWAPSSVKGCMKRYDNPLSPGFFLDQGDEMERSNPFLYSSFPYQPFWKPRYIRIVDSEQFNRVLFVGFCFQAFKCSVQIRNCSSSSGRFFFTLTEKVNLFPRPSPSHTRHPRDGGASLLLEGEESVLHAAMQTISTEQAVLSQVLSPS